MPHSHPTVHLSLVALAIACSTSLAVAQPAGFHEDFSGPTLDANWTQGGDLAGHPTIIAGSYEFTDAFGSPGVKLMRSTPGTLSSYVHEIEVEISPLLLAGAGGTQTDFKLKSFGQDGFMEIVLNSFGDMRVWHNDLNGNAGYLQGGSPAFNTDFADGDRLKIISAYDLTTDTLDVTFALNGDAALPLYSGGGIVGPIGDLITNFVEIELFKWGDNVPDQAIAAVDSWSLIPESVITCDFNADLACDVDDLNAMLTEGPLASGVPVMAGVTDLFDLNGDGELNLSDRDLWLAEAASFGGLGSPYRLGDANLDGIVDGQDFIAWNGSKFTATLIWDAGNFNGDSVTDGQDFV
ncbi:MAG: hypothetical protein AAGF97_11355, partial [Planctomycetota bacterium]